MKIDWLDKLRYFLQTVAFCLVISAIQYAFQPERTYEVPLVYSLAIGASTWALIDFGRHAFPSARVGGWPQGFWAAGLPMGGIATGYLLGTLAGDAWFGWSSWNNAARAQLPLSMVITAMAGITASYFFYSLSKRASLEAQVSEAQQQATEARLKLLETQLEPHMLFNTLANLRALIGIDPPRAQVMLDHLNNYLRATLSGSLATQHPLADEFDRLQDYLALMQVRMGARLSSSFDLPEALRNLPVPPLLLQPLVENAIQHGLEPKVDGGQIQISARTQSGQVVLEVRDTGLGFDPAKAPRSADGGFGLAQVRERVASAYEGKASVSLESTPGSGTTVRLLLPVSALAEPATSTHRRTR